MNRAPRKRTKAEGRKASAAKKPRVKEEPPEEREVKAEEEEEERGESEEGDLVESDTDSDCVELCSSEDDYDDGDECEDDSPSDLITEDSGDEMRWRTKDEPDTKPQVPRFFPARPPGPALDMTSSWTPLSLFQLFFSSSVVRTIIENTNKKATLRKQSGIKLKWEPLTVKDFYAYLSVLLYTSLVHVHALSDLWRKVWPYNFQFPGDTMGRVRFEAISGALHLCDPDGDAENDKKRGTPEYDRLFKLKPLYTDIMDACKANFQPHKNISIDERMVATRASIGFKQYNKNKPTKWGYKLFVLADSSTGYTWNFSIYTGKSSAVREKSLAYSSVMNLLSGPVLGSGYTLYVDNFYTSPGLFVDLRAKNIGCCGTMRKHLSSYPKAAQNDFPKNSSRGDIRWLRKDGVLFVKWIDSREVVLCSTVHKAFSGHTIKRTARSKDEWVKKEVPCPDAVVDYNKQMGGVDLSDALIGYYSVSRKTMKWYKTLFYHFLDIAVVNAFLLHKELAKLKGEKTKIATQKQFREQLCKEMLTFAKGSEPHVAPVLRIPDALTCTPMYYGRDATGNRKYCRNCHTLGRKKVKTPIYCRRCLIPLCLTSSKNCFAVWHDLNPQKE